MYFFVVDKFVMKCSVQSEWPIIRSEKVLSVSLDFTFYLKFHFKSDSKASFGCVFQLFTNFQALTLWSNRTK